MMEFVENSDKALAALEKRDAAKEQSNEVKVMNHLEDVGVGHDGDDDGDGDVMMMLVLVMVVMMMVMMILILMVI